MQPGPGPASVNSPFQRHIPQRSALGFGLVTRVMTVYTEGLLERLRMGVITRPIYIYKLPTSLHEVRRNIVICVRNEMRKHHR